MTTISNPTSKLFSISNSVLSQLPEQQVLLLISRLAHICKQLDNQIRQYSIQNLTLLTQLKISKQYNTTVLPNVEYRKNREKIERIFKFCMKEKKYKDVREILKIININDVYRENLEIDQQNNEEIQ